MKNDITLNFVNECKKIFELGISLNPNNDIAEEVLKDSLIFLPKNKYDYEEDPILDLIKNYDCSTFDIGMIGFYSYGEINNVDSYYIFGFENSGSFLAIDKKDKKIVIIDSDYEFIDKCCNNSESFLTNLIKVGNANIRHLSNSDKNKLAEQISHETNGNLNFYIEAMGAEKDK